MSSKWHIGEQNYLKLDENVIHWLFSRVYGHPRLPKHIDNNRAWKGLSAVCPAVFVGFSATLVPGQLLAKEVLWEALDGLPDVFPVHPKHVQWDSGLDNVNLWRPIYAFDSCLLKHVVDEKHTGPCIIVHEKKVVSNCYSIGYHIDIWQ